MHPKRYLLPILILATRISSAQTVMFFDDFEAGLANWEVTGLWNTTAAEAYSPVNCLTDSPDGNYPDMFSSSATMIVGADLSTALDADIQFQALVDLETAFDYVYVDASGDAGASWTNVYIMNGEDLFTWTLYTIPIGAFVGNPDVRVRFRFESDAAYNVDGLYIDDFTITKYNIDVSPPLILHTPTNLYEGTLGPNTLSAEIVDASGIYSTTLYYNVDGGAFSAISGINIGGDTYVFEIPEYAPGAWISYYIEAVDGFGIPNTAITPTHEYIAGNYISYDDGAIDFVADIGTLSMTGYVSAAVKVSLAGVTDVVTAIIQNYTDYMRPNDPIRFHVWADDGGFPGDDLITPFYVTPEPTLLEPNRGTRVDLRGVAELEGIIGDVFVGYDVPGGVAWISYTSTGVINRSYVQTGFGWSEFYGDFHFRAVTTELEGAPEALFSYTAAAEPTINFTDESTNAPTSWYWDFADGYTSTVENPVHTYMANGIYNVCLTATNFVASDTYCELISIDTYATPVADFSYTGDPTVTFTDLSLNDPTAWAWDFADGTTSDLQDPVHTYTVDGLYNVCLTASNAEGSANVCKLVNISNTPKVPVVDFTWSISGTTVSFTDLSTNAPDYWDWDFGDGGSSTEQDPSHFYPAPSSYTVCLTAGNVAGESMTCKVIDFNSVEDLEGVTVSVAPVPATDVLTVQLNNTGSYLIDIFSITGAHMLSTQLNGTLAAINVQHFAPGQYVLRIQHDAQSMAVPFTKQ